MGDITALSNPELAQQLRLAFYNVRVAQSVMEREDMGCPAWLQADQERDRSCESIRTLLTELESR